MKNLKNLMSNMIDSEITDVVLITSFSLCVFYFMQYLAFLLGNHFHIGCLSGRIVTDVFLFAVIALWCKTLISKDTFLDQKRAKKGWLFVFLAFLSVFSIYVYIVYVFQWWLLIISIVLIVICISALDSFIIKTNDIYASIGILLLYCISTYMCMVKFDMDPAIDLAGIIFVFIIAFYLLLLSACKN